MLQLEEQRVVRAALEGGASTAGEAAFFPRASLLKVSAVAFRGL